MYDVDPRALKVAALRDVLKQEGDYQMRSVFRWYSKVFHTPLHLVDSLPIEDILRAYYEEHYESLDEGELQGELYELTRTDEEAQVDNAQEDEFLKFAQAKAAQANQAVPVEDAPAELPPPEDISVSFVKGNLLEEYGDFDPFAAPKK